MLPLAANNDMHLPPTSSKRAKISADPEKHNFCHIPEVKSVPAPIRASVFHADVAEEAQQLAERVQREFNCLEFFISEFTPVMGAHTGPGIIGIAYCLEDVA